MLQAMYHSTANADAAVMGQTQSRAYRLRNGLDTPKPSTWAKATIAQKPRIAALCLNMALG